MRFISNLYGKSPIFQKMSLRFLFYMSCFGNQKALKYIISFCPLFGQKINEYPVMNNQFMPRAYIKTLVTLFF